MLGPFRRVRRAVRLVAVLAAGQLRSGLPFFSMCWMPLERLLLAAERQEGLALELEQALLGDERAGGTSPPVRTPASFRPIFSS